MNKRIFWIASYPKSGNTWMRAIVSSLFFSKNGIFDFKLLSLVPTYEKAKIFDFVKKINLNDYHKLSKIEILSKYFIKSQERIYIDGDFSFFKTHSCNSLIDNNAFTDETVSLGLIYLLRNPLDVAISYAEHRNKKIDDIIDIMMSNNALTATGDIHNKKYPILMSRCDNHLISWQNLKIPKIIIKYEDLLENTEVVLIKLVKFFEQKFKFKFHKSEEKSNTALHTLPVPFVRSTIRRHNTWVHA